MNFIPRKTLGFVCTVKCFLNYYDEALHRIKTNTLRTNILQSVKFLKYQETSSTILNQIKRTSEIEIT